MLLRVVLLWIFLVGVWCDSGCQCIGAKEECSCCVHLEIESLGVNDTGCVNVTYLPDEYGISVILEIDDFVIINETVSARNPPPLCAAVPYLKDAASICLDFYDLDVSNHSFSGCVNLEAKLYYVITEKIHLGCWKLGSAALKEDNSLNALNRVNSWRKTLDIIQNASQKKKQMMNMKYLNEYKSFNP